MSKFDLKQNVPKTYSYPFSRNEFKKLAEKYPAIVSFHYSGISPHDQINDDGKDIWLGFVVAKRLHKNWEFTLSLYANKNAYTENILELCQSTIIDDMTKWIAIHQNLPETSPHDLNRLYLSIQKSAGQYKSSSKEHYPSGSHFANI